MSRTIKEKYMDKPYLVFEVDDISNLSNAIKMYFSWQDDSTDMSVHIKQCKRCFKGHFGGNIYTKFYRVVVVPRSKVKIQIL